LKITSRHIRLLALASLMIGVASADTLHPSCTGCSATSIGTATVYQATSNPPTFSFTAKGTGNKPASAKGDFWLLELVPDNKNVAANVTLSGQNTTLSSVTGSLFNSTEWSSGKLDAYLSSKFSNFNPPGPLSAYLPATQSVDPGANGYFVYLFDFGYKTFGGNSVDPTFSLASGTVPQGSMFLALLTDQNTFHVNTAGPQSGALFVAGTPPTIEVPPGNPTNPTSPVPEPSSLMLMGSGMMALAGAARRRWAR
jgi:hypothetical protein